MENQTKPEPEKVVIHSDKHNHWLVGKIFWGLLFMLIGGLLLAQNAGILNVNWADLWRLWPLFVIAAGLSILSLRHVVWRVFMVIMAVVALGIVAWTLIVGFPNLKTNKTSESSVVIESSSVKQAEITVKAGAGSINIDTTNQTEVAKASLESSFTDLTKKSSVTGDKQSIEFAMDTKNNWWSSNVKNVLDINLTRSLPLTLNVDAGATQTNIDVSQAKLVAMNIKIGASSFVAKIGNIQDLSTINIESGVSSIKILVPTGIGVGLKFDGGLTSKKLADLTEVSENTYESTGYVTSTKKIYIIAKIGLSSFTIERY